MRTTRPTDDTAETAIENPISPGDVDRTPGGTTGLVPLPPTPQHGQLDVDGTVRHYSYLDPDPGVTGLLPLVLVFHGGGGNMATITNQLGFNALPAPRPYLTVFLQGDGPVRTPSPLPADVPTDGVWNSGHLPFGGPIAAHQHDDVAFVDAILLEVTRRTANAGWRIDQSRTYAIGYSNGGMMAYRLAAERSADFAAIAVIAGSIGGDPGADDPNGSFHYNHPGTFFADPLSVLHIHGLLDINVPMGGGVGTGGHPTTRSDLPMSDAIDAWVSHNQCDPTPTIEPHAHGVLRTWRDGQGGTEVQSLTMPAVAHNVPDQIMLTIEPFLLAHSK